MTTRLDELERENRRLRDELARLTTPAPTSGFRLEVLGTPRLARLEPSGSGAEARLALRRAWRALALLALSPGRRVAREELLRTLWPEADPARVGRNLPPTLYALRRALGAPFAGVDPVAVQGRSYALDPRFAWEVDAVAMTEGLAAARAACAAGELEAAARACDRALASWRGPFLAGDESPWVGERRAHYDRLRLEGLRLQGDLGLRRGDLERALDAYRLSLVEEPLQEEVHRALLRIYARQGRRDLVRRHFERFARLLAEELGVEPSLEATLEYHRLMAAVEVE